MMVQANFILIPPDGVVNVISLKLNKQFGKIKLYFDLTMIVLSIVLSLIFIRRIAAIGIGTIMAVVLVGRLINVFEYLLFKHQKNIKL